MRFLCLIPRSGVSCSSSCVSLLCLLGHYVLLTAGCRHWLFLSRLFGWLSGTVVSPPRAFVLGSLCPSVSPTLPFAATPAPDSFSLWTPVFRGLTTLLSLSSRALVGGVGCHSPCLLCHPWCFAPSRFPLPGVYGRCGQRVLVLPFPRCCRHLLESMRFRCSIWWGPCCPSSFRARATVQGLHVLCSWLHPFCPALCFYGARSAICQRALLMGPPPYPS